MVLVEELGHRQDAVCQDLRRSDTSHHLNLKLGEEEQGDNQASKQRKKGAMEYGHPCNSCSNKEKRPPLKRGQLKLQIARTLGSLVVPGAKSGFSFRR
ncbi:hypothetical protein ZWY2020_047159 [Hordeum vulgare]|nr:hypothetical protein ZWY2020_047159 [Hordeum vulgare]